MCDQDSVQDMVDLERRRLGQAGLGAAAAAMLPAAAVGAAKARPVTEAELMVATPDGKADSYFVHPSRGKHPGVLIWTDILGLRPAFRQMARRLAESGYSVLVPNPFYRSRPAPIAPAGATLADEKVRADLFKLAGSLNSRTHLTDAKAFIAFLDAQPSVDTRRKIGTMGYCMGGPIVLRTAGAFASRVGAAASFHGGGLVTDQPDSPHRYIAQMRGGALIAIADNDDKRAPNDKVVLRETFAAAGRPAEIEVYEGAMHGWCPPDSMVHNPAQAEKAWSRLLALLERELAA